MFENRPQSMQFGLVPDHNRGGGPASYPSGQPHAYVHVVPVEEEQSERPSAAGPASTTCPSCQHEVVTETVSSPGLLAWILVGIMFLLGLWLCCLIPLCLTPCHDIHHHCPSCKARISTIRRM
ncbi:unnamed protein product [Lampetra planeri]